MFPLSCYPMACLHQKSVWHFFHKFLMILVNNYKMKMKHWTAEHVLCTSISSYECSFYVSFFLCILLEYPLALWSHLVKCLHEQIGENVKVWLGYLFWDSPCTDCYRFVVSFYSVGTLMEPSSPRLIVSNQILFAQDYCWLFEIHLHIIVCGSFIKYFQNDII